MRALKSRLGATVALVLILSVALAGALSAAGAARAAGLPCVVGCTTTTTTTATTTTPTATTPTATTPTATMTTVTTTPTVPAPAPATTAIPGARYDGRLGEFVFADTVNVSANGKQVTSWTVVFTHGRCTDGAVYTSESFTTRPTAIAANGTATGTGEYSEGKALTYTKRGKRVVGREVFTAHFTFDGARVSGTLTDSFIARHYVCHSGIVRFRGYEDGTPQAPVRDGAAATGTYKGSFTSLRLYLPWHTIPLLHYRFRFACGTQYTDTVKDTVYNVPVSARNHTFRLVDRFVSDKAHGLRLSTSTVIHGVFDADDPYSADLRFSVRVRSSVYGRPMNSCGFSGGDLDFGPR